MSIQLETTCPVCATGILWFGSVNDRPICQKCKFRLGSILMSETDEEREKVNKEYTKMLSTLGDPLYKRYLEGYNIFKQYKALKQCIDNNPYDLGSLEHKWFNAGWMKAQFDFTNSETV